MRLGGLILTGGHSRRMGEPKQSLPIGDTTLLGRLCKELLQATTPVVVIARDPSQALPALPEAVEVAFDVEPGSGPMQALRGGLRHLQQEHGFAEHDAAFVTACDLPFLTAAAVRWLADRLGEAPLLMPRADGHLQPLLAIYRLRALAAVERLLANDVRSLRSLGETPGCRLVDEAELRTFDPSLKCFLSVNNRQQYQRALRLDRPANDVP